jgi:hypothetical protein
VSSILDLEEIFRTLLLPVPEPARASFSAIPIAGLGGHLLAKDAAGAPSVLLTQRPGEHTTTPIVLENLNIYHDVACTVTHPDGTREEGTFTIVSCSPADPSLFPHFLRILGPLLGGLGATPTAAAVRRMISALVDLFRALSAPAKKTIQGLWSELFLIANSADIRLIANAWHTDAAERFDFAQGAHRLEVKSTSNRIREHHFSLSQLTPVGGSHVVIASVFVERSGGGVAIQRLVDKVRSALDIEAITRFDATFYGTLGSAWSTAMNEAFDADLAVDSLRFFEADAIPRVAGPLPSAVTDVRFCSNLSEVQFLTEEELVTAGGIFAAVIPRVR